MAHDDDAGQDHVLGVIPLSGIERSGQICNIWRGFNTKSVARFDHQAVDREKRLASPAPKCHRDLQLGLDKKTLQNCSLKLFIRLENPGLKLGFKAFFAF